jgi:uncharacterized protein
MSSAFPIEPQRLAEICRKDRIVRLELFGSWARGEADSDSDVDLLVSFDSDFKPGLEYIDNSVVYSVVTRHLPDLIERLERLLVELEG